MLESSCLWSCSLIKMGLLFSWKCLRVNKVLPSLPSTISPIIKSLTNLSVCSTHMAHGSHLHSHTELVLKGRLGFIGVLKRQHVKRTVITASIQIALTTQSRVISHRLMKNTNRCWGKGFCVCVCVIFYNVIQLYGIKEEVLQLFSGLFIMWDGGHRFMLHKGSSWKLCLFAVIVRKVGWILDFIVHFLYMDIWDRLRHPEQE